MCPLSLTLKQLRKATFYLVLESGSLIGPQPWALSKSVGRGVSAGGLGNRYWLLWTEATQNFFTQNLFKRKTFKVRTNHCGAEMCSGGRESIFASFCLRKKPSQEECGSSWDVPGLFLRPKQSRHITHAVQFSDPGPEIPSTREKI